MKTVLALGWCVLLTTTLIGQEPPQVAAQRAAMKKLDGWVGQWKGTGWYQTGPGQKHEYAIHESIERRLDGLALVVEGRGLTRDEKTGKETPAHQALAVVSFDPKKEQYRFQYHRVGQDSGESVLVPVDGGWQWEIRMPQGTARFTVQISATDWQEKGAFSRDGKTWFPFMEMRLKKESDPKP